MAEYPTHRILRLMCIMRFQDRFVLRPGGISDRISFVFGRGGGFVVWWWFLVFVFRRGGGFVAFCRFFVFELSLRDSRRGPTPNGALKWGTRNHRQGPVEEDGLGK